MCYIEKYIPSFYYKSILDIDYDYLRTNGIENLLFDLDNTILSYNDYNLTQELKTFFNKLLKDFDIFIITNGSKKRLEKAIDGFIYGQYSCKKPFKFKVKKILKENNFKLEKTVNIGDQIISDISLGNKIGFKYTILVKPISTNTEKLATKFNRFRENRILSKIKLKFPKKYTDLLLNYENERK